MAVAKQCGIGSPVRWGGAQFNTDKEFLDMFKRKDSIITKSMGKKPTAFRFKRLVYYEIAKSKCIYEKHYKDRKYVWGIDPAYGGTGLSIIDVEDNSVIVDLIITTADTALIERSDIIVNWLLSWYEKFPPSIIIMESAFYNKRTSKSFILMKLNHLIEYTLYKAGGSLFRGVSPTAVKAYTIGENSSPKSAMISHIYLKYGYKIEEHNMCDAFAMAVIARMLLLVVKDFDITGYDVNDRKSLNTFIKDLQRFASYKKNLDENVKLSTADYNIIINAFASEAGGQYSLTCGCPFSKVTTLTRKEPETLIYHGALEYHGSNRNNIVFDPNNVITDRQVNIVNINDEKIITLEQALWNSRMGDDADTFETKDDCEKRENSLLKRR